MRKQSFMFTIIVLLALAGVSRAQTLRVLSNATVSDGPVMVGNVARLENMTRADAEALAQTVVAEKATARRIPADEILFALMTRSGRTDLATKIQVTGAAGCEISLENAASVMTSQHVAVATATVMSAVPAETLPPVRNLQGGEKLGDVLRASVLQELQVAAEDVRISFDTVNSWLDAQVAADARWQIRPMTRVPIGTVQWDAQLVQNNRILQKFIVQARVMRRTQAIISVKPIGRGEVLFNTNSVETQERWVDRMMPADTQLSKVEEVLGAEATRSIPAGEVLDGRSFRKADMLVKGDTVTVWFISNGMTIKGSARALSGAKLHERVASRNEISGETFEGTVIGRRIVVVGAVDAETEARLRKES